MRQVFGMGMALVLLSACSSDPNKRSDIESAATQPLRDTRIRDDKIPEVLQLAASAPYSAVGMRKCSQISSEINKLNAALGADADVPEEKKGDGAAIAATATRTAINSLIPGLGLVRLVTGADKQQRRVEEAVLAGSLRRSFLKGLGASKGCEPPAAPTQRAREAVQALPPVENKDDATEK